MVWSVRCESACQNSRWCAGDRALLSFPDLSRLGTARWVMSGNWFSIPLKELPCSGPEPAPGGCLAGQRPMVRKLSMNCARCSSKPARTTRSGRAHQGDAAIDGRRSVRWLEDPDAPILLRPAERDLLLRAGMESRGRIVIDCCASVCERCSTSFRRRFISSVCRASCATSIRTCRRARTKKKASTASNTRSNQPQTWDLPSGRLGSTPDGGLRVMSGSRLNKAIHFDFTCLLG